MVHADWLAVVTGGLLPLLVAVITARTASGTFKSVVLALLAAMAGVLIEFQDAVTADVAFDWSHSIANSILAFLSAVTAHFEVWRKSGVTGTDGLIQQKYDAGLGGE